MDRIIAYIDEMMKGSTPETPLWNIEKIREGKTVKWNYVDGCMIKAVLEMYSITRERRYLEFADEFTDYRVHEDGTIDGYDVEELNLDNINAGKTLFELWRLTGKAKYRRAIEQIYSQIGKMPRTSQGSFWHKNIYPNQVWLDGLYMCEPFYAEYETSFNSGENYDDILRQFELVEQNMRDLRSGLYYHAFDCSRKMFWCDKVTGLSNCFWLRAIGWFSMALLDTIEQLRIDPESEYAARYEHLKAQYVSLMEAMQPYQDESGMWYQVVNMPGQQRNYPETSGSAIMAYSYLKGVRLGLLPEKYREYGRKAFEGICERYLTEDESGLHLGGICLVAGLGGKQMRAGTFDYYMSEPIVSDDAKGVGPFLLAYTELLRNSSCGINP